LYQDIFKFYMKKYVLKNMMNVWIFKFRSII